MEQGRKRHECQEDGGRVHRRKDTTRLSSYSIERRKQET